MPASIKFVGSIGFVRSIAFVFHLMRTTRPPVRVMRSLASVELSLHLPSSSTEIRACRAPHIGTQEGLDRLRRTRLQRSQGGNDTETLRYELRDTEAISFGPCDR